jgi:tripartite-type tricarboxylate transporter receptor subunit TctC
MKKFLLAVVAACAALSWSTVWAWQPTKPITVISPVAPGSGNEMSFRAVASILEKEGKAKFVFDYKAGADGNIGMNHLVKQPADGHTIAIPACQSTFVASDVHYKNMLQYHPMKDLTLVTNIAKSPLAFVANASSRVNTVPELVKAVTRPDRDITFAVGGASHALAFEYFMDSVKGDDKRVKHSFYKGPMPALLDAASGITEFAIVPTAVANQLIPSGKVKIIGIAGEQKLAAFPNTALLKDYVPGLNVYACWNIVLPPNAPPEVVKWYLDNFVPAIRSAEAKKYFDANMMFIDPTSHTPNGLRRDMEQLRKQWQPYVSKMPAPL